MVNLKQLPQIFEDHLDAIRDKLDNSKQLRRFNILGFLSYRSLTNKKKVSEDIRKVV